MAHGQLLAPRAQGSKIKRFGAMPKVFNTWLAEGGDKWNQMMVSFIFLLVTTLIQLILIGPLRFISQFLLSRSSSNVRLKSSNKTHQIKSRTSLIPLHRQPECRTSFPDSATLYLCTIPSNQMIRMKNGPRYHQHPIIKSVLRCCSLPCLSQCPRHVNLRRTPS